MRPFTESHSKVMAMAGGEPVLRHHLRWLRGEGVTDAVIACGYQAQEILEYLEDNPVPDLRLQFSIEEIPLGRGGAAKKACSMLSLAGRPCILSQGDTISDMPLSAAYKEHLQFTGASVLTLLLVPYRSRHAVVEIADNGQIVNFREKPRLPYWAHAGTYICSPEFFSLLPQEGDENNVVDRLVDEERVNSFRSSAYWRSVDTLKDLREAESDLTLPSLPHEDIF